MINDNENWKVCEKKFESMKYRYETKYLNSF